VNGGRTSELELRRAVWRHAFAHGDDPLPLLRAEISALLAEYAGMRDREWLVFEHQPALCREYEAFAHGGQYALALHDCQAALREVQRGRRMVDSMRGFLEAHDAVEAARAGVETLRELAGAPRLRALPSVTAPVTLLELAHESMREGRHTQALWLARQVERQVKPLLAMAAADPEREAALARWVAEIRPTCAATRELLDSPAGDLDADGTLEALLGLAHRGAALAGRLADELEISLGSRRQFLRELQRCGDSAAALRGRVVPPAGDDLWASATKYLWRSRLDEAAAPPA
jgi:hypothetical protein